MRRRKVVQFPKGGKGGKRGGRGGPTAPPAKGRKAVRATKGPGPGGTPSPAAAPRPTTSGTAGRPPIEITPDQVQLLERMATAMCTLDEMADAIGISRRSFNAPHVKEWFDRIRRMKASVTKLEVRERQLSAALREGHPAHQIWWGKQHLGQKDKHEHSGAGASAFDQVHGADERLLQILEKLAKNQERKP